MSPRTTFIQKLEAAMETRNSLLCAGLDTTRTKDVFRFNVNCIDATAPYVCSYKPNSAFYEARGAQGIGELKQTCDYIHARYPDIPVILDAKRGDVESTNTAYAQFAFDYLNADAITLQPYLGMDALAPFLQRRERGCIILCRTSNKNSDELQGLTVNGDLQVSDFIAQQVITVWNKHKNCLLVTGATYPSDIARIRAMSDEITYLVPGFGAQGGDIAAVLQAGLNSKKKGLIMSASRSIMGGENERSFSAIAKRAQLMRDTINDIRFA